MSKLPPYGKRLVISPQTKIVILYVGNPQCWQAAKRDQSLGECHHLVLPHIAEAGRYQWPVNDCVVTAIDFDAADQPEVEHMITVLAEAGAAYETLVFSLSEIGLERIVASIMVSDIDKLKTVIVVRTLGLEIRTLALETLKCFYFEGDMSRSDLTAFLSSLFRAFKSEHQETDILALWIVLYDECLAIHPQELMKDIREACETVFLGEEYNVRSLIRASDYCMETPEQWWQSNRDQLLTEFGYIHHADRELESWGMNQHVGFEDWLGGLDIGAMGPSLLKKRSNVPMAGLW